MDLDRMPTHVAIIMDGNGRWAKKRGLPRSMGHRAGTENVRKVVKYCSRNGISYLTIYAFSTENFKRPKNEVGTLMDLLVEYVKKEVNELLENDVRLKFIGDRTLFSQKVQDVIAWGEERTKECKKLVFSIALGYGSRAEIVSAVNKIIASGISEVNEKTISEFLYTSDVPDPDLIIRTSGEERLSNFLLYQAAYSEFYFTDTLWPDFNDDEFDKAIEEYQRRDRRYGGVK